MAITPPGFVNDGSQASKDAWAEDLTQQLTNRIRAAEAAYARAGDLTGSVHLVADGDPDLLEDVVTIDWNAYPTRFQRVIGATKTNQLADKTIQGVQVGRSVQEEYLEWRVVRNAADRVVRIEMSTETIDYWSIFLAHDPSNALAKIAEFAGEAAVDVDWRDVFGPGEDPLAPGADKNDLADRVQAMFAIPRAGLAPRSPYNNGEKALVCMASGFNTLAAAVNLAAFGCQPYGPEGEDRPYTGSEMIAAFPGTQAAADCRRSDPVIFGAAIEQAWEGRKLALRDPAGLYIKDVKRSGVLMPNEDVAVPETWFKLTRGEDVTIGGVPTSFHQRLTLEVPSDQGFILEDCRLEDDSRLDRGGKLAQLVTIALYFKKSAENVVATTRLRGPVEPTAQCQVASDPTYDGVRMTSREIDDAAAPLTQGVNPFRGVGGV